MKVSFTHRHKKYCFDLSAPMDISIPLKAGDENPNCYYAGPVEFETIRSGDFIGSVAEGGPVNYQTVKLTPHGNGTHTECYGHISADTEAILNRCLKQFHFIAQVLTLTPERRENGDLVILQKDFEKKFRRDEGVEAVVIRTMPNSTDKKQRQYSGTNPCYLEGSIGNILFEENIRHLLVDLPSVDREVDGGALQMHRNFWNVDGVIRKDCTITELIYVDDSIPDGLYLLNLQITSLESDASPSKPVLFKMEDC